MSISVPNMIKGQTELNLWGLVLFRITKSLKLINPFLRTNMMLPLQQL